VNNNKDNVEFYLDTFRLFCSPKKMQWGTNSLHYNRSQNAISRGRASLTKWQQSMSKKNIHTSNPIENYTLARHTRLYQHHFRYLKTGTISATPPAIYLQFHLDLHWSGKDWHLHLQAPTIATLDYSYCCSNPENHHIHCHLKPFESFNFTKNCLSAAGSLALHYSLSKTKKQDLAVLALQTKQTSPNHDWKCSTSSERSNIKPKKVTTAIIVGH
jgi:hypothetical protein